MASIVQSAGGFERNSPSATVTFPAPATKGNVLIFLGCANRANQNLAVPSGFSEFIRADNGQSAMVVAEVIAAGGESAITCNATLGNSRITMCIAELSGVDLHSQSQVTSVITGLATSISAPPLAGPGILIATAGLRSDNRFTFGSWSSGFTTLQNIANDTNSNNAGSSMGALVTTDGSSHGSTITWDLTAYAASGMFVYPAKAVAPASNIYRLDAGGKTPVKFTAL